MKKPYTFIDLFSGCGGFSSGFEQAGYQCLLGVDANKDAIETFRKNHCGAQSYLGDIRLLNKKKLSELIDINNVDIVIGGPPCQGFSTVGRGKVEDDRNSLFQEFVRIVRLTKPKAVVFENVTGILAKKNRPILKEIFASFHKLGYQMDARVLSAEEFGVPSTRRRAILIGTKGCGLPLYPEISHGPRGTKSLETVGKAFAKLAKGKIYNHDIIGAQLKNSIDIKRLKKIPAGCGIRYEKDEKAFLPKSLKLGIDWEKLPEGRFRQTKYFRIGEAKPGPTILTSRTSYYHPIEPRYLTVREAASLQSFPKSFQFMGATTSQFRQIGNAVPPKLAKAIAMKLADSLESPKVRQAKQDIPFAKGAFNYHLEVQT